MLSAREAGERFGRGNVREWEKVGMLRVFESETGRLLYDKLQLEEAATKWQEYAGKDGGRYKAVILHRED